MNDYAHAIRDLLAAKQLSIGNGLPSYEDDPRWCRQELRGRLVELSSRDGSAALTMAMGLVENAQREGEPTAWITSSVSSFFPPDAAEGGVDLETLVVVRVPKGQLLRAADKLARSGAFGLIIVDLSSDTSLPLHGADPRVRRADPPVRGASLARLLKLAKKHDVAIVFLTDKHPSHPSMNSLVSLRGEAFREKTGADQYRTTLRALKEKRRAPGWRFEEMCRGPSGLC